MGFFDKLLGCKSCPECGNAVTALLFEANGGVCMNCDAYVVKTRGVLALVVPNQIADRPWFGSPLPWADVRAVMEGPVLELSAISAIAKMLTTKESGLRRLEARWPNGCCVCGKLATRAETVARKITIPRFKGVLNVGDQTVTLVADNILHCHEHASGIDFGRISFATPISFQVYGILFRSLAYRNAFRALNKWAWPEN